MNSQRIILDITNPVVEVYKISDEYLKKCYNINESIDIDIIEHLNGSSYFWIFLDLNKDIFKGSTIDDFRTLRTDGKWIWSADLNFYALDYGFKYPEKFIHHIKKADKTHISDSDLHHLSSKYDPTIFFILNNIRIEGVNLYHYIEIEL
jgi:hypothetical protein